MRQTPERGGGAPSSATSSRLKTIQNGSNHRTTSSAKARAMHSNGKWEDRRIAGDSLMNQKEKELKVGVLPLVENENPKIGDDGRAVIWLDIDNTLYSKGTEIHKLMTERIRAYIIGLGLEEEEAERLHQKYYKEYGLAIRGLVMHQKIDALDYDSKCDATLPLETVLQPNQAHKDMLRNLDRTKCRVWALTNAYKTHAVRVLKLLDLYEEIEGIIYCDYSQQNFACKPEQEFYDAALKVVGLTDTSRCYFVDDSLLNIAAARKLGWGHCVLFNEPQTEETFKHEGSWNGNAAFDASVFIPKIASHHSHSLDKDKIQKEFQKLTQQQRIELIHILLEASKPGDMAGIGQILEKQLRLTKDMFSSLPDEVKFGIFEKLEVKELLNCQMVCQEWKAIAAAPLLWKSHALGLTEGDSVSLIPPSDPNDWEPLVKSLYFRELNWSKGICQSLTLMHGHSGFVTAMKLKGRNTLVTGSYDETIRVWDLHTGLCKKVLTAKAIACLDFLDEEGILAAGLYDTGRVMVWDMKTWSLLQTLSGHNRGIRHIALSPDYLVSVGQDKSIVVWDWQRGIRLVRFGQQSNVSLGVSIIDRDKIVAVTVDGIIRTFDIRRKEMIGQFDLAKLSTSLNSHLSGLKGGTLMMQWFAAHRNTLTLASQNLVVHLKWHEHIVPVINLEEEEHQPSSSPLRTRLRPRSDSTASNTSTASNMTSRSHVPRYSSSSSNTNTTPVRMSQGNLTPSHSSSSNTSNRLMTPSRFNSTLSRSPSSSGSPSSRSSAAPWPTSPAISARLKASPSNPAPSTPTKVIKVGSRVPSLSIPTSPTLTGPKTPAQNQNQNQNQMRIAPNLTIAPLVVDIIQTPEAAIGCVDPAKKRIVLATRFSGRAGADRRIYSSTLNDTGSSSTDADLENDASRRDVVAIGGAWQSKVQEMATPAHNPMSIVLDHENCVVGTSEGLVYRMGFVGSMYREGWKQETKGKDERAIDKLINNINGTSTAITSGVTDNNDASTTITDLLQLRTVWKHLFV